MKTPFQGRRGIHPLVVACCSADSVMRRSTLSFPDPAFLLSFEAPQRQDRAQSISSGSGGAPRSAQHCGPAFSATYWPECSQLQNQTSAPNIRHPRRSGDPDSSPLPATPDFAGATITRAFFVLGWGTTRFTRITPNSQIALPGRS